MTPMFPLENAATWSLVQLEAPANPAQLSGLSLLSISFAGYFSLLTFYYMSHSSFSFLCCCKCCSLRPWLLPFFPTPFIQRHYLLFTPFIQRHSLLFTPDTSHILLFSLRLFSLFSSLSLSSSFYLVIITFHTLMNSKICRPPQSPNFGFIVSLRNQTTTLSFPQLKSKSTLCCPCFWLSNSFWSLRSCGCWWANMAAAQW